MTSNTDVKNITDVNNKIWFNQLDKRRHVEGSSSRKESFRIAIEEKKN